MLQRDGYSPTILRTASLLAVLTPTAMFVSPPVFSILLGATLALLFWARIPVRFPQITRVPLQLFVLGTVAAALLSPDPAASWPQVKKFWVLLTLAAFYSAVRRTADVHRVAVLWAACSSIAALWSFEQFARKWEAASLARADFYAAYIGSRVTGLRDHWMTFAGEQMIVVLMISALILFGPPMRKWLWLVLSFTLISSSLVISLTRGVWIATMVGLAYLVGVWRLRWLPLLPVSLVALALVGPLPVRERITSVYHAHGELDSNMHRVYCWRTGLEMVRAHPWFGLGPGEVQREFDRYIPSDLSKTKPVGFYGHLHNIYLQYAAERGVPTLLALLWLVFGSVLTFIRALRVVPHCRSTARFILHAAIAVTLAIMTEGFFETNLADSEILAMYLAVLGMAYVVVDARETWLDPEPTQSSNAPRSSTAA